MSLDRDASAGSLLATRLSGVVALLAELGIDSARTADVGGVVWPAGPRTVARRTARPCPAPTGGYRRAACRVVPGGKPGLLGAARSA